MTSAPNRIIYQQYGMVCFYGYIQAGSVPTKCRIVKKVCYCAKRFVERYRKRNCKGTTIWDFGTQSPLVISHRPASAF